MRSILPFALLVSLVACGGPPAETPAPEAAVTPEAAPPPAPGPVAGAPCAGASLTLEVVSQDAGAGSRFATLGLRNTSTVFCTLQGYPDIQLIGEDGQPRSPFRIEQTSGADPALVTLEPGGQAWFDMRTTAVAGEVPGETEPCPATKAIRFMAGGSNADAALPLNPCNQRASVTALRATAEIPAQ